MVYKEIKEYIGKKVIVTDISDRRFRGIITNTESEFDTESGKEEIELYTGKVYYGIPIDEIKSIMKIEKMYCYHSLFSISLVSGIFVPNFRKGGLL